MCNITRPSTDQVHLTRRIYSEFISVIVLRLEMLFTNQERMSCDGNDNVTDWRCYATAGYGFRRFLRNGFLNAPDRDVHS
jgi:hypothetical protein